MSNWEDKVSHQNDLPTLQLNNFLINIHEKTFWNAIME